MECKVKNEYGTIYIAEDVMLKVVVSGRKLKSSLIWSE